MAWLTGIENDHGNDVYDDKSGDGGGADVVIAAADYTFSKTITLHYVKLIYMIERIMHLTNSIYHIST